MTHYPMTHYPSAYAYSAAVARMGVTVLCALKHCTRAEVLESLSIHDMHLYLGKARVRD